MKVNKTALVHIINQMRLGDKHNPEYMKYIHQSGKYQTEINIAVQMVMFNRSYETAVSMLKKEKQLIKK